MDRVGQLPELTTPGGNRTLRRMVYEDLDRDGIRDGGSSVEATGHYEVEGRRNKK